MAKSSTALTKRPLPAVVLASHAAPRSVVARQQSSGLRSRTRRRTARRSESSRTLSRWVIRGPCSSSARHPYQADALLRLAGYLELAGQLEAASEHAERALYACEQAIHPMCRLLDGTARLSYGLPTNRPLFISLHKHMISAGRRGYPRTALEVGRLLLSLDLAHDPMHVLLHLDFYAARSSRAQGRRRRRRRRRRRGRRRRLRTVLLQLPTTQLPAHSLFALPELCLLVGARTPIPARAPAPR